MNIGLKVRPREQIEWRPAALVHGFHLGDETAQAFGAHFCGEFSEALGRARTS
jgi:hypothetical protein